jgi:putative phosphoribosyl transferase
VDKVVESKGEERLVRVAAAPVALEGNLSLPEGAQGLVLFAHGSGSSRHSPRNRRVARLLNEAKLATLLIDLLTPEDEALDLQTAQLRFDIGLLAERLLGATDWLTQYPDTRHLRVGYFGASTGAAAALVAAAERPDAVGAVVSRGGRPDLAGPVLARVQAPTLLIVGGNDLPVIDMNRAAFAQLRCEKRLVIIQGATHLFEEPGALDEVARLAREWSTSYQRSHAPGTANNRRLVPAGTRRSRKIGGKEAAAPPR